MSNYVARTFDMDFMYLDIAFCAVWMLVLLRQKHTTALWFGLFGAMVVFLVDDILWLRIQQTRFLEVPFNRDLFLLYFSFTYGMIEFSYVTVMFGAKSMKTKALWTLFLYGGWLATALISQHAGIDDRTIDIGRDMSNARIIQIAMVAGGYLLLLVLKYTWRPMKSLTFRRMLYLFLSAYSCTSAWRSPSWPPVYVLRRTTSMCSSSTACWSSTWAFPFSMSFGPRSGQEKSPTQPDRHRPSHRHWLQADHRESTRQL